MEKEKIEVSIRKEIFKEMINKLSDDDIDNFDDLIEDSLLSYLGIRINEITENGQDSNKIPINYCNYVYVYMDPLIKSKIEIGIDDIILTNEPFYVGKGKSNRVNLSQKRNQETLKKIDSLKNIGKEPILIIIKNNLNSLQAVKLESFLINKIGRKDLEKGPLLNKYGGIKFMEINSIFEEIGDYHIETGKNRIILDALNRKRYIKDAAKELGISSRTLHRRIIDLKICWDGKKYIFL